MTLLLGQVGPGVAGANSNGAGVEFAQRYQCVAAGVPTTINLRTGAASAGVPHAAIYADAAGVIDATARLTADITTGAYTANAIWPFTVVGGPTLVLGTFYWIAVMQTGNVINYTNFAATGGTERDTSGLSALANPHPTSSSPNANIANVWVDGTASGGASPSPQLQLVGVGS